MADGPERITDADQVRPEQLDQSALAELAAARDHELALRDSDNQRLIQTEKIKADTLKDQRQRRGYILAGLAVVVVALAIIAFLWTDLDRSREADLRRQQQQEQTARECIRAGNTWKINEGCLITQRAPGAGAPGAPR